MSAAELLRELKSLGVAVWPEAGALRYRARADAITPDLAARMKLHKPELMAILAGPPAPNDTRADEGDGEPAQNLLLLAALDEYDSLIGRLTWPEAERDKLRALRRRMSPDGIRDSLPNLRAIVASQEREAEALDNRITCLQCANRRPFYGTCTAASPAGIVRAVTGYVPDATLRHRCAGFTPKPGAPDQRTAVERWPDFGGDFAP